MEESTKDVNGTYLKIERTFALRMA